MSSLRVSELAERAGVTPSTVRFYERAGLLSSPRRAPNGYRLFDESALEELAFIARAKHIGMSLEEISDLVAAWPTGECRSLQARLRAFLTGRIGQVHEQVAELGRFERQLRAVLDRLSAYDPGSERCGKGCMCEADLDLALGEAAEGAGLRGCSLDRDELAARIGQWRVLAAAAILTERTRGAVRLVLPAGPELIAAVTTLCAAETACYGQTRFLLEITAGQIILTVEAPGAPDLLGTLFPASNPAAGRSHQIGR